MARLRERFTSVWISLSRLGRHIIGIDRKGTNHPFSDNPEVMCFPVSPYSGSQTNGETHNNEADPSCYECGKMGTGGSGVSPKGVSGNTGRFSGQSHNPHFTSRAQGRIPEISDRIKREGVPTIAFQWDTESRIEEAVDNVIAANFCFARALLEGQTPNQALEDPELLSRRSHLIDLLRGLQLTLPAVPRGLRPR